MTAGKEVGEVVIRVFTAGPERKCVGFWKTNSVLPVRASQGLPIHHWEGVRHVPEWSILHSQKVYNAGHGGDSILLVFPA